MLANIELYFVHGWGYDASVWDKWLPQLRPDVTPYIFNRGYFKANKQNFTFNISARFKVVIAHSLGLHYIRPIDFSQIHMLVLISSFRQFHEHSQNYKYSQKQVALMKQRLIIDPETLLADFYSNCGQRSKANETTLINRQLLYDDLILLDTNEIDLDVLKPIPQILLLHGGYDGVVDIKHSKRLNEQLPNSQLFRHRRAGHALPSINSQWCINTIQKQLSKKLFIDLNPIACSKNEDKDVIRSA